MKTGSLVGAVNLDWCSLMAWGLAGWAELDTRRERFVSRMSDEAVANKREDVDL